MTITIKSASGSAQPSIALPTGIVAGDLILVSAASYGVYFNFPSGWTEIRRQTYTATNSNYMIVSYVQATDTSLSGATINFTGGHSTYCSITAVVISGHTANNPINAHNYNVSNDAVAIGTNSIVTTKKTRPIAFYSTMINNSLQASFTNNQSALTQHAHLAASSYHASAAYSVPTTQNAGTISSQLVTPSRAGSAIGMLIGVEEAPPPSNVYVRAAGVAKLGINNVRVAGVAKQVPPTKKFL